MKLSAHLGFQFNEVPFLERFALAARSGYRAVEFPSPYLYDVAVLQRALDDHDLKLVQISAPMGDAAKNEKGIAAFSSRRAEFLAGLDKALETACALDCSRIHVMSGIATDTQIASWEIYVENIRTAVEKFAEEGIDTLIEVFSPAEVPGYFMSSFELADQLFASVKHERLRFLFDTYHAAALGFDVAALLERWLPLTGHIQISDFPGRNEPGTGALPFTRLFRQIDASGYDGFVGCEYRPKTDTLSGLVNLRDYLSN
jgi:2-dehydrotetronate isomerase